MLNHIFLVVNLIFNLIASIYYDAIGRNYYYLSRLHRKQLHVVSVHINLPMISSVRTTITTTNFTLQSSSDSDRSTGVRRPDET